VKADPPIPLRPAVIPLPTRSQVDDARFDFICAVGGVAVAIVDPRRRRVVVSNAPFAELLGYGLDAVEELPLEAFADAFPRALDGRITLLTSADGRLSWEARWRQRDGRSVDVMVHALEAGTPEAPSFVVVAHPRRRGERFEDATVGVAARYVTPPSPAILWIDADGRVAWVSQALCVLLGLPASELSGRLLADLSPDLARDTWRAHWSAARERSRATFEASLHRQCGRAIAVEVHGAAAELDGVPYLCAFVVDLTSRERSRRELAQVEERYALAALGANDGLWDWDLISSRVHYSPRWASLFGYEEHELPATPAAWLDRVHPDDRPAVDHELERHLDGLTAHFESEHRVLHRDNCYRWVLFRGIAVRDDDDVPLRMAGSTSDITHRKNAEARLRFEAFHDALTGLPNRALLIRRLHQAIEDGRERGPEHQFAVVFVDIDDFKLVNDSLGHTMGDMLLRAIASRLKRCVRGVDTVARLGGDEFCLLLDHVSDIADVLRVADRVQEEMGIAFNLRGYEVFTSASVGVAINRAEYHEAEDMLRDANIAMYRAKSTGRGKRAIFDASMRRAAVKRLTLETDLRRALERREFEVFYQPVISLATGTIRGFEALLRWPHPKRGLVMPSDFIPLAEETGLIVPIGRWVLHAACEQAVAWSDAGLGPLTVSVNVSGRQLALPYFVDQVAEVLEVTGLAPERLHLEITESVLMDNAEAVVPKLNALCALGARLDIDDFGTGYSSLAYLHRFPIHVLKIDRSFVMKAGADEDSWAIIETIRSLAALLGVAVTAEGVETAEQLTALRELGCDYAQGYHMSRPVPAQDTLAMITEGTRW